MSMETLKSQIVTSQEMVTASISVASAEELDTRFAELVSEAAERAQCTFLFELPGELLSRPATRIAVIHCDGKGSDDDFFLVFDEGELETVTPHDLPKEVRDFVASYRRVLTCLSEVKSVLSLH